MSSNIALWVDEGTLHTKYNIAGMCLHVSAINHMPKQLHLYPPTLFVPMLKDHPSALKAKHASKGTHFTYNPGSDPADSFFLP